jgi:glyoxylate/hydroxypyruvate reductase
MLRVVLHYPGPEEQQWLSDLRQYLPGAQVQLWATGSPPADYAVVWAPPQQLIDEQSGLKAVFNLGAGVDRLLQCALPPSLKLLRLEDAGMATQMAEYVCHALVREFRDFGDYQQQASRTQWAQRVPRVRDDFVVGIMGLGLLGGSVSRAVRAFGFPVRGWSRSPRAIDGVACFSGRDALAEFLAGTRFLVCLLPLTDETQNLLCRATLSLLPRGASLVNLARGHLLVDEDLIALLDSGHLSAATLDVFRSEPLPETHPFWSHPKISVTPHIAAQTLRHESLAQIAEKIRLLESGQPVSGIVDRKRGY